MQINELCVHTKSSRHLPRRKSMTTCCEPIHMPIARYTDIPTRSLTVSLDIL